MRSVLSLQMPPPLLQHPSQGTCLSPHPSSLLSEWLVSVPAEHMAIWLRVGTPTFSSISARLMRLPEFGFSFFCYPNNCHMRVLLHIGNYIPYISGFTNEVSHKYILLPTIFKSARSQRGQSPRPGTMGGAAPTLWVCAGTLPGVQTCFHWKKQLCEGSSRCCHLLERSPPPQIPNLVFPRGRVNPHGSDLGRFLKWEKPGPLQLKSPRFCLNASNRCVLNFSACFQGVGPVCLERG